MFEQDTKATILSFAAHIGGAGAPPEDVARRRNWLDEAGRTTADGLALLDALGDQSKTRTAFRGNF